MHRRVSRAIPLALAIVLFGGCATSRTSKPAVTKVPASAPASTVAAPAKEQPLTQEEQEARAEAFAHYATGVSYELKGDQEKSIQEYLLAAKGDPSRTDFVMDVARRLIRLKKAALAAELLLKAIALPNSSGNLDALLGVAYAQEGKKEQALAASHNAIRKAPDQLQGYQNLFHLYLQTSDFTQALKALDDAAKISSNDLNFVLDLAELYLAYSRAKPGELDKIRLKIIPLLEKAAKLDPDNALVVQRLAENYLAVGDFKKGAELFTALLKQFGNQPALRDNLRARLTDVYLRSGDNKKAAEQLEAIITNDPTNPQAYFFLGSINREAREFAKAAEFLQKAILLNAEFEDAYYELALAQMAQEKSDDAMATLEKARAKFPKRFYLEFYTALVYNAKKDYAKAAQFMTAAEIQAKATEPRRLTHQFYFQAGAAHERNKDYEQAEKYFQESLRLNPEFPDAMNYLGYMWAERGVKLEQALPLIEKAVKLEPENGAYLDSLAWVRFKLGKPKEALAPMLKAIEKSEEPDATLFDHLGDIYAALKQHKEAREAWSKAVKLEPNPEIQKKLDAAK